MRLYKPGDLVIGVDDNAEVPLVSVVRRVLDKRGGYYLDHLHGGGIGIRVHSELKRVKKYRIRLSWTCYNHHEHRFKFVAHLCMRLNGPPKYTGLNYDTVSEGK